MHVQIQPAQASEAVAKPSTIILLHSLGPKRLLMMRTGRKRASSVRPIVPVPPARWRLLTLTRRLLKSSADWGTGSNWPTSKLALKVVRLSEHSLRVAHSHYAVYPIVSESNAALMAFRDWLVEEALRT
jgi:hypothetical protein